jgi:hypothetical protein
MTTERFDNQASAGWTTYGTGRAAFHAMKNPLVKPRKLIDKIN